MLFMSSLIEYNLLHFLGIYQQAAVMGIVWIKASYKNVANQNGKTGIAHHQHVESIPNWELTSGFSAIIFQAAFWKDSEETQYYVPDTQHPPTRTSCIIIIKQMLLASKGKCSLVKYFVIFDVWVFQRRSVLVLIWFARQGVLQGKSSPAHSSSPSCQCFFAWCPSEAGSQAPTSNRAKSDSTKGSSWNSAEWVYIVLLIRNTKEEKQQEQHSWHLYYCVYKQSMQKQRQLGQMYPEPGTVFAASGLQGLGRVVTHVSNLTFPLCTVKSL